MTDTGRSPSSAARVPHVLTVLLVTAVLAGNNFLTSSGPGEIPGARPWAEGSVLRDLAELLNLNFQFATPTGTEVKDLVFGVGAALAAAIAVAAAAFKPRSEPATAADLAGSAETAPRPSFWKSLATANLTPLRGAQVLMVIAVVWSFQSVNWSHAKLFAFGGSAVMALAVLWALGVAFGLNLRACRFATAALLVVSALTAALAVWYYYERNPVQRAKYPIGNPLFLAAVLIPAFLLSVTEIIRGVHPRSSLPAGRRVALLLGSGLLVVLILWVFLLAGSPLPEGRDPLTLLRGFATFGPRASIVGVVAGLVAVAFFAGGRRTKLVCGGVMVVLVAGALLLLGRLSDVAEYGRGATVRLRQYAWSYAFDLLKVRPWTGVGQGGFSLLADEMAGEDALLDPTAFEGRVSHAHNEWLETWTDLGTLGFVFVMGSYVLTFVAGRDAVRRARSPADRWPLIGSLAALAALMVEECTNVGLRLPGLPAVYFTVLGLTWARISVEETGEPSAAAPPLVRGPLRGVLAGVGFIIALAGLGAALLDWQGALAQQQAPRQARGLQFEQAVQSAERARSWRLNPVRRLEASDGLLRVYTTAAAHHLAQAEERTRRAQDEPGAAAALSTLAEEDIDKARRYAREGLLLASWLRESGAPSAFQAGVLEAQLCGMLAVIEARDRPGESTEDLRRRALQALTFENQRHRVDEPLALQLLQLAYDLPTAQRVSVLLGPIRAAPITEALTAAAKAVFAADDFGPLFAPVLETAVADMGSQDAGAWKNPLSPEIVRLSALHASLADDQPQAAELAGLAAEGYRRAGRRLQVARVAALVERSRYLLLDRPDDPSAAAEAAAQAAEAVPKVGDPAPIETPILVEQAHQHLAVFEEDQAGALIRKLNPGMDPALVPELLSRGYVGLTHRVLNVRTEPPLDLLDRWLLRAIQKAPQDPEPVLTRARVLFLAGRDEEVVEALVRLEALSGAPQVVDRFLERVLARRSSAALGAFRDSRRPPTTAPASAPQTEE